MHRARAGVHGDVIAQHAENRAIQKRMREVGILQLAAREASDLACWSARLHFSMDCGASLRADDVNLVAGVERDIFCVGMERHRHRAGSVQGVVVQMMVETFFLPVQRPGSRRSSPDRP